MVSPATPLSVLFLVAFVLLLLSTLSTPIIKSIPLASYQNVNFGVFGYCQGGTCSDIGIGYTTNNLFSPTGAGGSNGDFSLPSDARHSLSSILVVHPIAAFLTLVCLALALGAHFHSPAHSPRYLLALLIVSFPTLLITLLAFLVDILLFVPHQAWGVWIVLAATILIMASEVVTCAMRRTLVSRKARKKRIAENAEMNGENYYDSRREALAKAESPPTTNGSVFIGDQHRPDKLPQFATYDYETKAQLGISDDRIPVNRPEHSFQNSSPYSGPPGLAVDETRSLRDASQIRNDFGSNNTGRQSRDGSPLPQPPMLQEGPAGMIEMHRVPIDPRIRRQGSNGTLDSTGSGRGPPPFYGRGRGADPNRGGFAPRGGYPSRGGNPPRGGFPPGRGYGRGGPPARGMRGTPPPGWNGNGRSMEPPMGSAIGGRGTADILQRQQHGPPPGYDNRYYEGPQQGRSGPIPRNQSPSQYYSDRSGGQRSSSAPRHQVSGPSAGPVELGSFERRPSLPGALPSEGGPPPVRPTTPGVVPFIPGTVPYRQQALSPSPLSRATPPHEPSAGQPVSQMQQVQTPIGQAVEMDATTGNPSRSQTPHRYESGGNDATVKVTHEPLHVQQPPHHGANPLHRETSALPSVSSVYSQNTYVPPRAGWAQEGPVPQSYGMGQTASNNPALSPIEASPISPVGGGALVELPTVEHQAAPNGSGPTHARVNSSDNYYEDVDPRFAEPQPLPQIHVAVPSSLMPGYGTNQSAPPNQASSMHLHPHSALPETGHAPHDLHQDIPDGSRSPATSDTSHFTSVSQRGINPNWRPPPGSSGPGSAYGGTGRRPVPRQEDVILEANPDFALPSPGRGRGGPMGMGRGRYV